MLIGDKIWGKILTPEENHTRLLNKQASRDRKGRPWLERLGGGTPPRDSLRVEELSSDVKLVSNKLRQSSN